jgi:hypothetical protein
VLKKLIGPNGVVSSDAEVLKEVNNELNALLQVARKNNDLGVGHFYTELIPATIKAGAKLSSTWFKDVFILKKKDAPEMIEQLTPIDCFRELKHARVDARTALRHIIPDDVSLYRFFCSGLALAIAEPLASASSSGTVSFLRS